MPDPTQPTPPLLPPSEREPGLAAQPAAGGGPSPSYWYGPQFEPEEPAVPMAHYLWVLRRHRWKILGFVAAGVIATAIISSRLTPIYEATATIDIDRRMPASVLGPEASESGVWDSDQFLATQVKLVQSDSVLRPVVQRFKLGTPAPNKPGQAVALKAEEAPVRLPNLKVTRPPNTYLLLITYRSPDPRLAAEVANAIAHSYIEHTYNIRFRSTMGLSSFMERQLEELKANMERSAAALLQFERELNVINPEERTSILSARLLELNTEYTRAQAERLKKEAAWLSVREGSLDAAQSSSQGDELRRLNERLNEAQEKFALVRTHYGANHPEYRKASAQVAQLQLQLERTLKSIQRRVEIEYREALNREEMLKKAVNETKAEVDRLNARSFEYQALKREAEADKKLYEELVRKIKEAGINAGFQNSAIRLADPARPPADPVYPNLRLNLALAFLFSSLLAVGAAILSDRLDNTVRDPEQVRRTLGTDVVGSLPLVREWRKGELPAPAGLSTGTALVPVSSSAALPRASSQSFDEAIRTLRNSIFLGCLDRPLKTVLITSAGPAEGKTTTAVHLAVAHAQQGYRTLLIDGDLRRPGVHRLFGVNGEAGLTRALCDGFDWRAELVRPEGLPDLAILPSGKANRRAAILIGRGLPEILAQAAQEYDLIVIDSPPVVGFPEPLQMAAAADGVVLLALAGETNRQAVHAALTALERVRANVVGLVLNEVTSSLSDSYRYYGYYGKYYRYYHRDGQAG
jgi:succinoglycan biosynthesis transport protein ExoP